MHIYMQYNIYVYIYAYIYIYAIYIIYIYIHYILYIDIIYIHIYIYIHILIIYIQPMTQSVYRSRWIDAGITKEVRARRFREHSHGGGRRP